MQAKLTGHETNLFVCKHVEIDGFSQAPAPRFGGQGPSYHTIRIKTDEYTILLEGTMTITDRATKGGSNDCPKCGTELEEDPEDSSEGYCPKCNYGWRFPR